MSWRIFLPAERSRDLRPGHRHDVCDWNSLMSDGIRRWLFAKRHFRPQSSLSERLLQHAVGASARRLRGDLPRRLDGKRLHVRTPRAHDRAARRSQFFRRVYHEGPLLGRHGRCDAENDWAREAVTGARVR